MTRKPFLSLLGIAGLSLALMLALVIVTVPSPAQALLQHCVDAIGACRNLLLTLRADGSPILLVALLAHLSWSAQRGAREGWRQWRATRAALDLLATGGRHAPAAGLAALCAVLGIAGCVEVVTTDSPLALCHGLWRPRIWLSTGALAVLGPAELAALLGHERAHRRRRDPLRLLVARSLAAAFPYLPVLRELATSLPVAQELAADRAVIRAGARDALGRALLVLVEGNGAMTVPALATGMVSCLDARIDQLTGAPVALPGLSRRALVRTGGAWGGGVVLLIMLLASRQLAPPPGPPPVAHGSPLIGAPLVPGDATRP